MNKLNSKKIISLILKLVVVVFSITGTLMCVFNTDNSFMGGATVLMYFTIQSNLALAIVSLIGGYIILFKNAVPKWWYKVKYVATLSITLTGAVFCFMLAPTMKGEAWNAVNIFTHVIVPVCSIADFFIICIDADYKKKDVFYVVIPPIAYLIFASIGYALNWEFASGQNYPYFFLNWGSPAGAFGFSKELPFMGCMWWIILLCGLLLLVGLFYLWILYLIQKRRERKENKSE